MVRPLSLFCQETLQARGGIEFEIECRCVQFDNRSRLHNVTAFTCVDLQSIVRPRTLAEYACGNG